MARKKKLVNRVISAVMALVMVLAYMPMPAPLSVSAAEGESTNEASVTLVGAEGQQSETRECATLAEAVTAANTNEGSIITLLKDVSTAECIEITGKDITLELNGKTLTGSHSWSVLKVDSTGSLTIKSSLEGGKIATANSELAIDNEGALVIENGAIENTTPENGVSRSGIASNGMLTIYGGDISATTDGVYVANGKVTINGGDIRGGVCSIEVNPCAQGQSAELIVNDGKLIGTSSGIRAIAYSGDVAITVNDGYISGGDYAIEDISGANTTINGGTLNGENVVYDEEGDTGAVTLGEGVVLYDENYDVVRLSDATGTVYALKEVPEEAEKISVTVGANVTKHVTLAEAVKVANVNEGSIITLLKDVSTAERIEITGKDITLELNGKTLTGSHSDSVLWVSSTGSLTIKNSVEEGMIVTANSYYTIDNNGVLVIESGAIENTTPKNGISRIGITSSGTLTIYGGDISATTDGVYVTNGKATINGGDISGEYYSIELIPSVQGQSAELIVNDGKLIGTKSGISASAYSGDVAITVNDGYISGGDYAIEDISGANTTINGGTLNGENVVYDEEGDTGAVTLGEGVVLYDENYDVVRLSDATGTVYALKEVPEEAEKISVTVGANVTKHVTLAEAVKVANANEGSIITLLKDVSVAEEIYIEGKNVTLELKGKVLSGGNGNGVLRVTSKGSLTVKSSVDGGKITTDNGDRVINNHGILVIDSGTIINTYVKSGATTAAIISKGTLTVNGGAVSGNACGIDVRGGKTTVNGGEISGDDGIVIGVASSNEATADLEVNGGKIVATARGIYAGSVNGEQTVTINGGEVIGDECAISNGTNCKTTINGGTLTGEQIVDNHPHSLGAFLGDGVVLCNESGEVVELDNATGTVKVFKGDIVATLLKDGELTAYDTLEAAVIAAGDVWSDIIIIKDIKIDGDMTIHTQHNWYVSNNVTVTLADNATLTVEGALTNNGTISGGVVTNLGVVNNNGTIGKIVNKGTLYSCNTESVITGELVINWGNAEDGELDLSDCYFPNGLTVSGTIGEKDVTITDVLPKGYTLVDEEGNEIAITEGQTSVSGAVHMGKKKMVKFTSGNTQMLFDNLQDAFYYAEDYSKSTITLLDDVTVDDCVHVYSSGEMVFDLNGKKVRIAPAEDKYAYSVLELYVATTDKFTITSSAPGGCIDGSEVKSAIYIDSSGSAIIESGTFVGGYFGIENDGNLVVNGGDAKGNYSAIDNSGKLTVNGGTFEATGVSTEEYVCVTLYNNEMVTINGGTFNNASTIWSDIDYSGNVSAVVLGGIYPKGFGILGEQTIADVLPSNSAFYKSSDDSGVTITEGQTSVAEAVYVKSTEVVSVATKDGNVKKFAGLQNAFDYAYANEGSTVTLLDDITTDALVIVGDIYSYMVTDIATLTLDLNGKTWNYTDSQMAVGSAFVALTIKSSVSGGKILAPNASGAVFNEIGMLTVESGTIVGGQMGIANGGQLFINGGTVMGDVAVYNRDSVYVNGGTVTGTKAAILNERDVVISGGTLDCAVTIMNYQESEEDSIPTVSIEGGEYPQGFAIDSENAIIVMIVKDALAEGCAFVDAEGNTVALTDDMISIIGAVSVDSAKNISVTTKDGAVKYYAYLSGALAEATKNPGSTVTLLTDITTNISAMAMGGEFTIDLNGKKYTLAEGDAYTAIGLINVDVTIKSGIEGGTIDASAADGVGINTVNGTLTIEDCTIIGDCAIESQGTVVINDGTFKGNYCVVHNLGTATINGGDFEYTDKGSGSLFVNAGKLVINGGTYKGNHTIDYDFNIVTGPMMGEVVIADGINVYSYDGTDEESLLKNIIAEGYAFFREDGTAIVLEDDQRIIAQAVTVKAYGDANNDDVVDIKDAVMLKKHLAGMTDTGIVLNQSDVNGDGTVDIGDAVKLMQYLAGYEDIVLGSAS